MNPRSTLALPVPEGARRRVDALDVVGHDDLTFTRPRLLRGVVDHRALTAPVVATADHREEFDEHGLMSHGDSLYNQALHVPLILVAGVHFARATRRAIAGEPLRRVHDRLKPREAVAINAGP